MEVEKGSIDNHEGSISDNKSLLACEAPRSEVGDASVPS